MTHPSLTWTVLAWVAIALNLGSYLWQAWSIYEKKSGAAVSAAWFVSSIGLEIVNFIFGQALGDRVFTSNAIICFAGQLFVCAVLGKYKKFNRRDKALTAATVLVIVFAVLSPFKTLAQMLAQGVNILGGADQPLELKASQSGTGALALLSILTSGTSALIWSGYCLVSFGLLGPAPGYLAYTIYSAWMVWEWCKKAKSANAS